MRKDREAAKRLLHAIGDIDDQYLYYPLLQIGYKNDIM